MDSLFFQEHFVKFSKFFTTGQLVGSLFSRFSRFIESAGVEHWFFVIALIISPSSELGIMHRFFNGFLTLLGTFCQIFRIFFPSVLPVAIRFDRFSTIAGSLCQPWGTPAFLCLVLTHPGLELRTVYFVCFLNHLGTFWPNLGFFINQLNWLGTGSTGSAP